MLKAALIQDFQKHWMHTGARIRYAQNGDEVIINYGRSDQSTSPKLQFYGPQSWLTELADGDMVAEKLFNAKKEVVEAAFKELTGKRSWVWRRTGSGDVERPVLLCVLDGSGFLIFAGNGIGNWPARGVVVGKKILH
jgi:hypothetical protein